MALLRSQPQTPPRWLPLLLSVAALWLAPLSLGLAGLMAFSLIGQNWPEFGLGLWVAANALLFSPLFSWLGWLIALPALWAALRFGWFGWISAALIGAAAGAAAGGLADTKLGLPFGVGAVLALRLVLGRLRAV